MTRTLLAISLLLGCLSARADIIRYRGDDGRLYFANVPPAWYQMPPTSPRASLRRTYVASAPVSIPDLIKELAHKHDVEPRLVHAIIRVESDFDPRAVSRSGAQGLMQLMPATSKRYQVEDPFNPRDNIEGGIRYLKDLTQRFPGDIRRVLAAYNAGAQAVYRYGGIPPYEETQHYVKRVLNLYGAPPSVRKLYRYWTANGGILFTDTPR